ncbi:MAG: hypothetical protein ACT4NL_09080 [Pseudomarimonas sp.]
MKDGATGCSLPRRLDSPQQIRRRQAMKAYQISYDLRKTRDYAALYERIKQYGTFAHALESTWVIVTNQSATQIRDNLAQAMDSDDGLLVTFLAGEAAWRGLSDQVSRWLKEQLERKPA